MIKTFNAIKKNAISSPSIIISKLLIFVIMVVILFGGIIAPIGNLLKFSLYTFGTVSSILAIYFIFADATERAKATVIVKPFFIIVSGMAIFAYQSHIQSKNEILDYKKTAWSYQMNMPLDETKKKLYINAYKDYNKTARTYIDLNSVQPLVPIGNIKRETSYDNGMFTIWYYNFALTIISTSSLFVLLWCIVDLKIFQTKKHIASGKATKLKKINRMKL